MSRWAVHVLAHAMSAGHAARLLGVSVGTAHRYRRTNGPLVREARALAELERSRCERIILERNGSVDATVLGLWLKQLQRLQAVWVLKKRRKVNYDITR